MSGKVAVVTGATGGIGKEIARGLVRLGAHVVIGARDAGRGEATRAELGAESGGDIAANQSGHHDVEQNEVRVELACGFEGVLGPILDVDFVAAGLLEVEFEKAGEADFVVDQQDAYSVHIIEVLPP